MLFDVILLIIAIVLLVAWWFYGREKIGTDFPNTLLKQHSYIPKSIMILWFLRGSIFVLVILLWAHISITQSRLEKIENKKNIILTLDVSNSMRADDISPSRLEKAKNVLTSFIEKDTHNNIGYTIFAGKVFTLSPPSKDRIGLYSLIKKTSIDSIDQSQKDTSWTNIGDALISWIQNLEKSWSGEKIIIILTDGRANIGISPLTAIKLAQEKWVKIYSIGVWNSSWSVLSYVEWGVRKYFYDPSWQKITADIDEDMMRSMAEKTWGKYYHADSEAILDEIFFQISTLFYQDSSIQRQEKLYNLSPYICIILCIFALLHGFLNLGIRQKYKYK